jgi:hypothetical protein
MTGRCSACEHFLTLLHINRCKVFHNDSEDQTEMERTDEVYTGRYKFPSSKLSYQSKFYDGRVLHIASLQLSNTAIKTKHNVKINKHGAYKQEICNRIQSD